MLAEMRTHYNPVLPDVLKRPLRAIPAARGDNSLKSLFPHTSDQPFLTFEKGTASNTPLNIGVVFSGGQAAGGHNAIAGISDAMPPNSRLFGFLDGPSGIVSQKYAELTYEKIAPYRNQGGFDLIGSGQHQDRDARAV